MGETMENITNIELPKEMHNIKILAAIGLYKTESEVMKNSIRRLRSGSIRYVKEIRNILDRALGEEELSLMIRRMREESN
ncbi:MAG: hypothetical protein KKD69_06560 [Euryarchaeota archaeon]|nr:hypothetical protein [Euryarchaeota archaeon]MBU4492108.1 hypothetical protein [Euryarchaeota archaeon]